MTGRRSYLTLALEHPYDLHLTLFGHGWIDLAPHRWEERTRCLHTVCDIGGRAVDVRVDQRRRDRLAVRVDSARALGRRGSAELRAGLHRMLRIDEDLDGFWNACRGTDRLGWVARRRAGRMMQSFTLFEDLMKLLFTTNCSWAATRSMCQRLVEAVGRAAPSGERAFPTPEHCARRGARLFREKVHAGYRSESCQRLARAFARGELDGAHFLDPSLTTEERRSRLSVLSGFGPYAVGLALRGMGHYEDLALDSWCRSKLARILGRPRPPSDRWIERSYAEFGTYRGLAMWMELTADWHGEASEPATESPFVAESADRGSR